jgi:hypothetical protein
MPCYKPVDAWRKDNGQVDFYNKGQGRPLKVPCGQCIGCRVDRSKEWALRCVHEAQGHKENCFITLTYNAENLPPDGGLRKKHFQDFMKRLRKHIAPQKVRFYHCGEYGDKNNRPHYHAILFGYNFDDWIYLFDSESGHPVYTSPKLEKIWKKGFVTIGEVTFESAAYVARYIMKKINGKARDKVNEKTGLKPYERFNSFTGEVVEVSPEYTTMSRRPGIGHSWFSLYSSDVYPKGFVTHKGKRMSPPRYYDEQLRRTNPDLYDRLKAERAADAYESPDNSASRLAAREKVSEAKHSFKKRTL